MDSGRPNTLIPSHQHYSLIEDTFVQSLDSVSWKRTVQQAMTIKQSTSNTKVPTNAAPTHFDTIIIVIKLGSFLQFFRIRMGSEIMVHNE